MDMTISTPYYNSQDPIGGEIKKEIHAYVFKQKYLIIYSDSMLLKLFPLVIEIIRSRRRP